ncbi:hypothetical protein GGTG_03925 [Gaeumannomyces tritici R3-111a-1]|uniref:Uncharacterized protein n=1 Tax=Gaeumannomyces tritici (strain R3-111a-1) TaxID=644352 RepID=J3NRM3_GAET3|nr:hypothetical protein GGTG_03925 [Gaeumannomyces tritici R3-111a-1]EJT78829.1 hypothetical protein GGTG_03925 [Gaeumannomyces tritici R3-111a-1]
MPGTDFLPKCRLPAPDPAVSTPGSQRAVISWRTAVACSWSRTGSAHAYVHSPAIDLASAGCVYERESLGGSDRDGLSPRAAAPGLSLVRCGAAAPTGTALPLKTAGGDENKVARLLDVDTSCKLASGHSFAGTWGR